MKRPVTVVAYAKLLSHKLAHLSLSSFSLQVNNLGLLFVWFYSMIEFGFVYLRQDLSM